MGVIRSEGSPKNVIIGAIHHPDVEEASHIASRHGGSEGKFKVKEKGGYVV